MSNTAQNLAGNSPVAVPLLSPEAAGFALGVTATLIWGAYLAMARAGVNARLGAPDIAFIRYEVAGLIMLPWLLRRNPLRHAGIGWHRSLVLTALAGPLFVLIGAGGYRYAPLAHGAVFQPAALTIGAMIAATLLFGEKLTLARTIGIGTILLGLAIIAGPNILQSSATTPIGDGMFITAGLMWADFSILSKCWNVNPVAATAVVSVLSALLYAPGDLAINGIGHLFSVPAKILVPQIVVQDVLSGVVAVIAYSRAVQLLGPGRAAVFRALVPAAAILIGIPIVGEWPSLPQSAGLAFVTAGLMIAIGMVSIPSSRLRPQ